MVWVNQRLRLTLLVAVASSTVWPFNQLLKHRSGQKNGLHWTAYATLRQPFSKALERMNISSPRQAYVALSIAYWSNADVIEWAVQRLQSSSSDRTEEQIQDIAWINTKQKHEVEKAGELLESCILKDDENFKFSNYEKDAKQMLSHRIQQYLNGDCQPYDLCQMVSPIEHFYDFPDWLGDLYNSCDWCEPNSHPSDFKHLEQTANEVLNAL